MVEGSVYTLEHAPGTRSSKRALAFVRVLLFEQSMTSSLVPDVDGFLVGVVALVAGFSKTVLEISFDDLDLLVFAFSFQAGKRTLGRLIHWYVLIFRHASALKIFFVPLSS